MPSNIKRKDRDSNVILAVEPLCRRGKRQLPSERIRSLLTAVPPDGSDLWKNPPSKRIADRPEFPPPAADRTPS